MSGLMNLIPSPFRECLPHSYHSIYKKDDDLGIQKAIEWTKETSMDPQELRWLNIDTHKEYGKKVIEGLKNIEVNSSNEEIVRTHLVQICRINSHMRRYFLDHIDQIPVADPKITTSLYDTLCVTYPPNN